MILQALVDHYEDLLEEGKISRPGWGKVKVSFGLNLDEDGEVIGLFRLRFHNLRAKRQSIHLV